MRAFQTRASVVGIPFQEPSSADHEIQLTKILGPFVSGSFTPILTETLVVPPEFVAAMVYEATVEIVVGIPVISQLELSERPVGRAGVLLQLVTTPPAFRGVSGEIG